MRIRDWSLDVCSSDLGFDHPALGGTYDLIVANILAHPLIELAPDIRRHLAPGGTVILSGLRTTQEPEVLAAYTPLGLHCRRHFRAGDWSALLLRSSFLRLFSSLPYLIGESMSRPHCIHIGRSSCRDTGGPYLYV